MITYGRGLINSLINKLPFELHIPGYKFCGPGTRLQKRLARGDLPKNPLDNACREHDIAYSKNREDLEARHQADNILAEEAWKRSKDSTASIGERVSAAAITGIMKTKTLLGAGHKKSKMRLRKKKFGGGHKKKICLRKILDEVKKQSPNNSLKEVVMVARKAVRKIGGRKKLRVPRILPMPKIGGVISLVPLFAALSAAGALSGGIANVAKAINQTKVAHRELEESKRHNKTMEAIALGKGLYLKPYRKGLGLHINDKKKN